MKVVSFMSLSDPGTVLHGLTGVRFGSGAGGSVYETVVEGRRYAVKRLAKKDHDEVKALEAMGSHRNIVPLLASFEHKRRMYMVLPVCDRLPKGPLPLPKVKQLARHVLRALHHIHVVHDKRYGDLKASNVMVFSNKYVLIDFGYCEDELDATGVGTLDYFAPELCGCETYMSKANDIWALGVLVFKMLTGVYPFYSSSERKTKSLIRRRTLGRTAREKAADLVDPETAAFLDHVWHKSPKHRPTVKQVMKHPWLAS